MRLNHLFTHLIIIFYIIMDMPIYRNLLYIINLVWFFSYLIRHSNFNFLLNSKFTNLLYFIYIMASILLIHVKLIAKFLILYLIAS